MRLVAGVLALTLYAPLTRADEGKPAESTAAPRSVSAAQTPAGAGATPGSAVAPRSKVSLRVIRMMPESRQAVLFDRARGSQVVVEIGHKVDGYVVEDIDEDEVTLVRDGRQIVLVAPTDATTQAGGAQLAGGAELAGDAALPVDPYAPPIRVVRAPDSAISPATVDGTSIQLGEDGIRIVRAPSHIAGAPPSEADGAATPLPPGADGVRVAIAPGAPTTAQPPAEPVPPAADGPFPVEPYGLITASATTPLPSPQTSELSAQAPPIATVSAAHLGSPPSPTATPAAVAPAATPPVAPSVASAAMPSTITVALSRGEVDSALANFAGLAGAIRGNFSPTGLVVDAVGEATLFERAGLRAGDVITTVNGSRLRSLDDAATLYARMASAKQLTAQILRGGKPLTLHITIQ